MAIVEDQNREFTRDQEGVADLVLKTAQTNLMFAINPRFHEDLARLDKSFRVESIASPQTVFVVAGETIISEVLDRYICGILREEIDKRGAGQPFKRALIIGAKTWKESYWITEKSPAISIGGVGANELSKDWLVVAEEKGIKPFPLGKGSGVYLSEPRPRAVLSGLTAEDTKEAVEKYIANPRGLKEFLDNSWH